MNERPMQSLDSSELNYLLEQRAKRVARENETCVAPYSLHEEVKRLEVVLAEIKLRNPVRELNDK